MHQNHDKHVSCTQQQLLRNTGNKEAGLNILTRINKNKNKAEFMQINSSVITVVTSLTHKD